MITRLEIDGFKTFRGATLDVAPFQAIVGPIGAGTSNLFDAIALLSAAAEFDLRTAFDTVRGGTAGLFTSLASGRAAESLRLAVEMLVEPTVEDRWGVRVDVRYTRMRYEVTIVLREDTRGAASLVVTHESLAPIPRGHDSWARRFVVHDRDRWLPPLRTGRTAPFISTAADERGATVLLHQDGRGGDTASAGTGRERTLLSTIASTEFPHAFAAREEMRRWRTVRPDPAAIRGDGSLYPHSFIADDGGNVIAALARMKSESEASLARVSRDIAQLAPSIVSIDLDEGAGFYRQRLLAHCEGGIVHGAELLADGELRMLALAALVNDPDGGGVIAIDEPENGLDTAMLSRLAPYVCGVAGNFADRASPLRQVLLATHSSVFARELAAALVARHDAPVHVLPELAVVYRAAGSDPWDSPQDRFTNVVPLSPSQQLDLGFDDEVEAPRRPSLFDVEQLLAGAPLPFAVLHAEGAEPL